MEKNRDISPYRFIDPPLLSDVIYARTACSTPKRKVNLKYDPFEDIDKIFHVTSVVRTEKKTFLNIVVICVGE